MQISRRVTNGLAWAGLCLVVGVPTADFISGQFMAEPASANASVAAVSSVEAPAAPVPAPLSQRPATPAAVPVEVAEVKPAEPVAAPAKPATSSTAVDNFLASGKPLPSYITGAGAPAAAPSVVAAPTEVAAVVPEAAATPAAASPAMPAQVAAVPTKPVHAPAAVAAPADPVQVAAVTPQRVAPIPMPLSMRPKPVAQLSVGAGVAGNPPIVIPSNITAGTAPAPGNMLPQDPGVVTTDDLASWEYGPLSDFLAQQGGRGVAPQRGNSSANVTYDREPVYPPQDVYDSGRSVYIGPVQDDFFFPFAN